MSKQRKPKRDEKIILHPTDRNRYRVENRAGDVLLKENENYYIYFKNVNFKPNGMIEGRYQGENPSAIIDSHCREVSYNHNWQYDDDQKLIKTARMVAVDNKKKTIVIIASN